MHCIFRICCQPRLQEFCKKLGKCRNNEYIVIADPTLTDANNKKCKYLLKDHLLIVRTLDTYCALPLKIIMMNQAFKKMKTFSKYTHYYKADDDCRLLYNNQKLLFAKVNKKYSYAGNQLLSRFDDRYRRHHLSKKLDPNEYWYNREYPGKFKPYFNGAYGYSISRKFSKQIMSVYNYKNLNNLYAREVYEDLMIGKLAAKFGYEPYVLDKELRLVP